MAETGTMRVKSGLAEMLKGGVIMDVVNAEQAVIAENAGACAVMALERVPADIRRDGGVARMSDPGMIREIQESVSIPVMAKCRIGHFAEAQILQALEVDYIDESEVLTPADIEHHVDKWGYTVPFVCGATNLGEALRRISEGAAMIRTKGEAGTGDVVNAVTHMRAVFGGIRRLQSLRSDELYAEAKNLQAPYELVRWVAENGRLPVVTFTAGGIATPADASLCMQLGADGVFVGSGIFKSGDPDLRAQGDRRGDDPLPGRKDPGRGLDGSRRADGRHLLRVARRQRAARSPRLVAPRGGGGQGAPRQPHRKRLALGHFDEQMAMTSRSVDAFRRCADEQFASAMDVLDAGTLRSRDPSLQRTQGKPAQASVCRRATRLVHCSMRIGVLALQGAFREHVACCGGSASMRTRCACRNSSTGSTGS